MHILYLCVHDQKSMYYHILRNLDYYIISITKIFGAMRYMCACNLGHRSP